MLLKCGDHNFVCIFVHQKEIVMNEELKQLVAWFESYQITFKELRLSESENIFDLELYIDTHLRSIKRNYDNPTFRSDIDRLKRLKIKLESMM